MAALLALFGRPRQEDLRSYDAALKSAVAAKLRAAEEQLHRIRRSVGGELRSQSVQFGR
jgi:hypothetical protein